jgi:hypothetical protein
VVTCPSIALPGSLDCSKLALNASVFVATAFARLIAIPPALKITSLKATAPACGSRTAIALNLKHLKAWPALKGFVVVVVEVVVEVLVEVSVVAVSVVDVVEVVVELLVDVTVVVEVLELVVVVAIEVVEVLVELVVVAVTVVANPRSSVQTSTLYSTLTCVLP